MRRIGTALACAFFSAAPALALETTLVPFGAAWRYLDDGSDQGAAWRAVGFDDAAWSQGPARLGYGDDNVVTVVGFGPDPGAKHPTTYFRTTFSVDDPSAFSELIVRLRRDDGAAVYLNGAEVGRSNLPAGPLAFTTLASSTASGAEETAVFELAGDPADLVAGENTLAVEVHQRSGGSSDLGFDLELLATDGSVRVVRGPYLQRASDDAVVVRWRTAAPTSSRVFLGSDPSALDTTVDGAASTVEHEVVVDGLDASTLYYYGVGDDGGLFAGGDGEHFFVTSPPPSSAVDARIWVLGDSGTADASAEAVRNAYRTLAASRPADLMVMLGDNAYNTGTDVQYQAAVFDTYRDELRSTVLWPALGNHDVASDSATQSGPYFDAFTLPTWAEAGGAASGTEAYYSFDYGDVHFVCLDSHDSDRSIDGAMLAWLEDDLAATNARWLIAYWHHPPYSKGSHDSDAEGPLVDMRENALPLLEAYGVDLVLAGHSHSYERSALVDSHYGVSSSLSGLMIVDAGDGDPAGSGAYRKSVSRVPHEGTVYAVAGSSGRLGGGSFDHPIMVVSLAELGSLVVDVADATLDAIFLDTSGMALDAFRIEKTLVAECGNGVLEASEDCDDANTADGDCCPSTCRFDGDCLASARSKLKMRDADGVERDRVEWKWTNGAAFDETALGDPAATTGYRLCVHDETLGAVVAVPSYAAPAGASWSDVGESGATYKDGDGSSDAVRRVRLRTGQTGKSSVRFQAKGSGLTLPPKVGPDRWLDVDPALRVDLVSSDGRCWRSTFAVTDIAANRTSRVKARARSPLRRAERRP